ncbi:hypothetical protein PCC7424_0215 [Gloeothece citriformis PCC 7424]|uniref:Uncharacterized protein n=1 Tax=Gloeothece citriformis (strain PCC 7424) TaxID=65393 RepID=B7KAL1_GLOC7|nr:hypothetical protein [Gloeothece citriformis]ACK68683.1 hypothetical protein PCC7424_0215 [Gloeothece citriformis PCC 7424]
MDIVKSVMNFIVDVVYVASVFVVASVLANLVLLPLVAVVI